METPKKDRPSEEEMWAGPSGERWLGSALRFELTMKGIGEELLARAALRAGEQVVDIGCGAGAMSLEAAGRVAPGGSVTGLDISPGLVKEATRRAEAARPKVPVTFVLGDAARTTLRGKADCLISRFGIMFFTDPYGAFVHLRGFLKPGGRLALACWMPMALNPWMMTMRQVMAAHFELPVIPPRTPGPFAFGEAEYLRDILAKAGFGGIEIAEWKTEMYVGGPGTHAEAATEFLMQALSIAQRAVDASEAVQVAVKKELQERLGAYVTPGGVKMPAAVWFATARA
jgi:ubiquinone/menaquinone biosynthesis C-methylase UbiE